MSSSPVKRPLSPSGMDGPASKKAKPEEDGVATASAGTVLPLRKAKVTASFDLSSLDYANPNNVLYGWDRQRRLGVHYNTINPKTDILMKASKSKDGKQTYYSIGLRSEQRFFASAGGPLKEPGFNAAWFVGPFAVANMPSVDPCGNRVPRKNAKFVPKNTISTNYEMTLLSTSYAPELAEDVKDLGRMDFDAYSFMKSWYALFATCKGEMVAKHPQLFPNAVQRFENTYAQDLEGEQRDYEEAITAWTETKEANKDNADFKVAPAPAAPDTSADRKQRAWEVACKNGRNLQYDVFVSKEKRDRPQVSFKQAVFSPLWKSEVQLLQSAKKEDKAKRDAVLKKYHQEDPWKMGPLLHPEPFMNDKGESKEPYLRGYQSLQYYRMRTAAEAAADHAAGKEADHPLIPIPPRDVFIIHGDVVAPIFSMEVYDNKASSGVKRILRGVIWLGREGELQCNIPAVPGVDPTTYARCAQPYTRKEGFSRDAAEFAVVEQGGEDSGGEAQEEEA